MPSYPGGRSAVSSRGGSSGWGDGRGPAAVPGLAAEERGAGAGRGPVRRWSWRVTEKIRAGEPVVFLTGSWRPRRRCVRSEEGACPGGGAARAGTRRSARWRTGWTASAGPGVIGGIADRAVLDSRFVKGERERLLAAAFMHPGDRAAATLMPEAQPGEVIIALAGAPGPGAPGRSGGGRRWSGPAWTWRRALGPAPLEELQAAVLAAAGRRCTRTVARQSLPGGPYSLGMRALDSLRTWPRAGSGRPRRSSRPAPASPSAAPS